MPWSVGDMHFVSSFTRKCEKFLSPMGLAMAHRWQYKYDTTGASFVKSGTTFEKSGSSFWKSGTTFWKTGTTSWKSGTSFWKVVPLLSKVVPLLTEVVQVFGIVVPLLTKLVPVIWYLYCHLWAMAWPTGDRKLSQFGWIKRRGMYVTYGPSHRADSVRLACEQACSRACFPRMASVPRPGLSKMENRSYVSALSQGCDCLRRDVLLIIR